MRSGPSSSSSSWVVFGHSKWAWIHFGVNNCSGRKCQRTHHHHVTHNTLFSPLLGGGFRQSQGSIPSFWLNNHGQILPALGSGAVYRLCFWRGGPHEDRKQDNRKGVSFASISTKFADPIRPISRRIAWTWGARMLTSA